MLLKSCKVLKTLGFEITCVQNKQFLAKGTPMRSNSESRVITASVVRIRYCYRRV